jgi:leucyl-tRNA synthetase
VFTGAYVVNPINNEQIPVWIADYVLTGYGTGAIMAVPAHDERDNEFAVKYDLPLIRVVKNDAPDEACTHDEGIMMNSGSFDGQASADTRENIVKTLSEQGQATEKTNYKMRDWSVSRQRYWGAPIPIVNCPSCGPQLVPDEQLPVVLPELVDFQPSGDGRSALARATDWLKVTCPNCGNESAERETDTLDTYICSSWYMFRYFDPRNTEKIFDTDIINKWAPIDFYNGGDHATAHLLYARFVTRFFTKIGIMNNPEPFKQMLFNGKVMASDGSAFSKSKGNGVDPLEIIESGYGADALRTYLMFAAPLEFSARWDPQGVPGTHRFLSRVWNLTQEYLETAEGEISEQITKSLRLTTHTMIKKMTEDIRENRYNTAIAAAMANVNDLYKIKVDNLRKNPVWQESLEALVTCIAPFAPHIADELWHQLGHDDSVQVDHWPAYNDEYLVTDEITIAVQVNGKVRGEISVAADASKEDILTAAAAHERVASFLEPGIKKSVYVPGRLVNFVV